MAANFAGSSQSRDISKIPRLVTPLVDIAVGLQHAAFRNKRDVINRAKECNVKCILPGWQMDWTIGNKALCSQFSDDELLFTAGVHPNCVPGSMIKEKSGQLVPLKDQETRPLEQVIQEVRDMVKLNNCVAIGETGLDYNRNPNTWRTQKKWCAEQVRLACELQMPLFMHEREAFEDLQKILRQILGEFGKLPPIVMHCFTGERWQAQAYIDTGFYIGVTGFLVKEDRGRKLRGFMKDVIPLDRLLLETDSPFMGFGATDSRSLDFERNNEPCTLPILAATVAKLYDVDVETVARMTTVNAQRFYRRDFGVRQVLAAPLVVSQPTSLVATMSHGQAAPVSSSVLSIGEREALKLAKKLRQIMALEELSTGGRTLPDNQQEKVASKASVTAEFLAMMETLPPTSDIIDKVQDVMSAMGCAADGQVHGQPVMQSSVEVALDIIEQVQDVTSSMSWAADEQVHVGGAPEQRWRPRGGRSGFRRLYAADHVPGQKDAHR